MAKRTGILASRYAYINEPQQISPSNGGGYASTLQSYSTPTESINTRSVSLQQDIDLLQSYTPDPFYELKKRDINASRYAPQNISKPENIAFRHSSTYKDTTTKSGSVIIHPHYISKPNTPPIALASPIFPSQSTGQLPYKVQHRVLTAIQILLEESCYDYALKWLPHILEQNNWTCSEAVEMAKWKTVLSGSLPEGSITLSGRYSINQRLSDGVRIRNITAHREPCDNNEIRSMILDAQCLAEILKDVDKVRRLGRLRDEIDNWERSEGGVFEAGSRRVLEEVENRRERDPRRKLHDALQEITEHPFEFDEMDWAAEGPKEEEDNAQNRTHTRAQTHSSAEEFGDEMEWE